MVVESDTEVKVFPGHSSRGAGDADRVSRWQAFSGTDENLAEVTIKGFNITMIQFDINPKQVVVANRIDIAIHYGINRILFRPQVNTCVERVFPRHGMIPVTIRR